MNTNIPVKKELVTAATEPKDEEAEQQKPQEQPSGYESDLPESEDEGSVSYASDEEESYNARSGTDLKKKRKEKKAICIF